jgi:hypothetical protein
METTARDKSRLRRMNNQELLWKRCNLLLSAYKEGGLGITKMPEDAHPVFENSEERLAYFSLPMSLNYQRDSYALWEAALRTFNDVETRIVFDVKEVAVMPSDRLQKLLLRHKLALQPNKHIATWQTIAKTVNSNWGSFQDLFKSADSDYLKLRQLVQIDFKKGFPYLSGPKIFNYWSFILSWYGQVPLKNTECIEIAPDTHITQCSVKLGLINEQEAQTLPKEELSKRWRDVLNGSGINPITMHPPLWFWSRNGFVFNLDSKTIIHK